MSTPTGLSPVPGTSKYNKGADVKDIPSDDSDTNLTSPSHKNKRFRKRRLVTYKSIMEGAKKSRTESVCSTPSRSLSQNGSRGIGRDMELIEIASTSSLCPSPVEEQQSQGSSEEIRFFERSPPLLTTPGLRNARSFSSSLMLSLRRWSSVPSDSDTPSRSIQLTNGLGGGGSSSKSGSTDANMEQEMKWVLYSIWNPVLELKGENGELLIETEAEELKKRITACIDYVTPFPDLYKYQTEFKMISVEGTETDEGSGALTINGKWAHSYEEPPGSSAELKPAPLSIANVLSSMLSRLDLLILFKSADTNRKSFCEQYPCIIHVTSKDYKLCNPLLSHVNLDDLSSVVQSEKNEVHHERYGTYVIEKYLLLNDMTDYEQNPAETPNGPLPIEMSSCDNGVNENNVQYANRNYSASANNQNVPNGDIFHPDQIIEPEDAPSPLSDLEPEPVESDEDNESVLELDAPVTPKRSSNFSLEYWMNEGLFTPGALRPKVQKSDSKKSYQYHKLNDLAVLLNNSVEEDVKNKKKPMMMVKDVCYTYGVVVEVIPENRHPHSYFFRISDETMESVLVRIHTSDKNIGPQIELGQIVRLHRITVQIEWDAGVGDNAMVLSTSAHHNYVIFKQTADKSYRFSYDTCAMSITIGNYDRRRVGELQVFKSNRTNNPTTVNDVTSNEEEQPLCNGAVQQNTSTIKDIEAAICRSLRKSNSSRHHVDGSQNLNTNTQNNSSSGICYSDLASPMNSEQVSSLECSQRVPVFSNSEGVDSVQSTEDSFFSAQSDLETPIESRQESPNRVSEESGSPADIIPQQGSSCFEENRPRCSAPSPTTSLLDIDVARSAESSSPQLNFTLFKNLCKTGETLNLLCQIVTLGAASQRNEWHVILKDLERTMPSVEFKSSDSDSQGEADFLELTITNAKSLVERNIAVDLYNDQGTDEFYKIEDVKIKGDKPPYVLEVDGKTCNIERYRHLLRDLQLERSFSLSSNRPEDPVLDTSYSGDIEDNQADTEASQRSQQNHTTTSNHRANGGTASNQSSTQSSVYGTPNATLQTPAEVFVNEQQQSVKRKLVWTGKPGGKRKPREHYQPEDAFDG